MGRLRDKVEIEDTMADLVVRALDAREVEPLDRGRSGVRIRDFDIVFNDGRREPLEITLDAEEAVV